MPNPMLDFMQLQKKQVKLEALIESKEGSNLERR